ncbi:hypothetical protein Daus18300_009227 [Diaporthe australafricana]|uniref:Protein kinase domain-containing protein n=1 Tax=Diaporthe australafricana TaxID=127596 RepID=A0ABR3WFI9_9PEZI
MSFSESDTEEYQKSIAAFQILRNKYERHEANDIGERSFILVNAVNNDMLPFNENGSNLLGDLLQASYDRYQNRRPHHKPTQVHGFLAIFYTLLDLQYGHLIDRFIDHIPPLKLPIERAVLEKMFPANEVDPCTDARFEQLARDICKQQWQWCALEFNCRMGSKIENHEHIVPITARSKIKPTRDGAPNTDRKTTLWVVDIPMECLSHDITEELKELDETDVDPRAGGTDSENKKVFDRRRLPMGDANVYVQSYKLVIKQYSSEDFESFDQERTIFNLLRNQKGIVKYFGWYEHREKDADTGIVSTYYNLVLERGTQDLYSAFQRENPPITYVEIDAFWSSLFDVAEALASIQKIDDPEDTKTRYVWHGDIKPENILDVQGRFKLADPGEACSKAVPRLRNKHSLRGDESPLRLQVPGGTKSFAAPEKNTCTYTAGLTREIPHVTQAIDIWSLGCVFSVAATYVVAGKEGVKQYRLLRQKALKGVNLGVGDAFHDAKSVLPEVTSWHQYLRTCIRTQDDYTSKVLDIVDDLMLITPDKERVSGSDLTEQLANIKDWAAEQSEGRPRPPEDILEFLDKVLESPGVEHSPTLEDIPRTISRSGAAIFDEALLYRSLRSEGRPLLLRNFGSRQTIFGQDAVVRPSRRTSDWGTRPSPHPEAGPRRPGLPQITTVFSPEGKSVPMNPPITFWEVETELMQQHSKMSRIQSFANMRQYSPSKLMKGRDDQLAKHFHKRDLVYLVDNASTMARFWNHATYLLRVMVWRSLKWDEDGMDLLFTTGRSELGLKPKAKKGSRQKPEDFVKKMDSAKPSPDGQVKTDMTVSLELILGQHMRDYRDGETLKRGLTILVLTDGLWGANDDNDVDDYLANFIKNNKATRGWDGSQPGDQCRRRPIGIQFIRFGHHPEAISRLQRLDDELKNRVELSAKEIPDMIDTESADGDFYKMFLGSMLEDIDNKLTQGGGSADALSIYTGTPASAISVDSLTSGSRRASGLSNILHQPPSHASFGYRNDRGTFPPSSAVNADERSLPFRNASFGNTSSPNSLSRGSEPYHSHPEQPPYR